MLCFPTLKITIDLHCHGTNLHFPLLRRTINLTIIVTIFAFFFSSNTALLIVVLQSGVYKTIDNFLSDCIWGRPGTSHIILSNSFAIQYVSSPVSPRGSAKLHYYSRSAAPYVYTSQLSFEQQLCCTKSIVSYLWGW